MANGTQRRRGTGRKGVHAIFTSEDDRSEDGPAVVGVLIAGIGVGLWLLAAGLFGPFTEVPLTSGIVLRSTTVLSSGMLFLVGGVAICTYSLLVRRTRRERDRQESAIYELEESTDSSDELIGPVRKNVPDEPPSGRSAHRNISKTAAVALVQSLMMIGLYGLLVQEYNSNLNMRGWIHTNFILGDYILNYDGLLVAAGVLGVVMFHFLPGRRFSE